MVVFGPHERLLRCLRHVMLLSLTLAIVAGCGLLPRRITPAPTMTPSAPIAVIGGGAVSGGIAVSAKGGGEAVPLPEGGQTGMVFTLSEGSEKPVEAQPVRLAEGQPLTPEALQALLKRLPALEGELGDEQAFRLPVQTLPPPRPGETIAQPFPPPAEGTGPGEVQVAPLQVLRFSPEGDVPLAPYLSVTFDQPMVPVATLAQLAQEAIPVKLTPEPEGGWRWVGTKTLLFEPVTRFPMATEYTAEVPAGTRSANEGVLAEAKRWTFRTPPPTLTAFHPNGGPTVRDPLLFVAFDQRITPIAVLESITVSAEGRAYGLRMATDAEVQADETVRTLAERAGEGRWVAFRAADELPYGATVTVNVAPGTPSAEGPLTTAQAQSYAFTTYGPLLVQGISCGWNGNCPPLTPWWLQCTNPLDAEAFDPALVSVDPALPDMQVSASGNQIQVQGRSSGRTTYRVTVRAGLKDVFGQRLEKDATLEVKVGSANPSFYAPGAEFVVFDPASKPSYSVFSMNYASLQVQGYAVEPSDWPAYQQYLVNRYRDTKYTPPGRQVLNKSISPKGEADQFTETVIDLSDLRDKGRRHVILVIQPEQGLVATLRNRNRPDPHVVWVQMSSIALDAALDSEEMLAWANDLATGAPLKDVELTLYPGQVRAKTDADGMATLTLAQRSGESGGYLLAKRGQETAILPEGAFGWSGSWVKQPFSDAFRWYVRDDRQMYRPGEEVSVKGWARRVKLARGSEALTLPGSGSVTWELTDSQGNRVANGTSKLNALGGFDFRLTLSEAMNLGSAQLHLVLQSSTGGADYYHAIQVQEFRRPEFEVQASVDEGPFFVGDAALARVEAKYYAGGPLPGAETQWNVSSEPGSYSPPNWDEFTFGFWTPWWLSYRSDWWGASARSESRPTQSFQGVTDASGVHLLKIALGAIEPPRPTVVHAEASVMDVNRQAWAASTQLLVHPADRYVGLKSEPTFVQRGQPIQVDAIVTDLDGAAQMDVPIQMRAVRLRWAYQKGEWRELEVDEQTCALASTAEPVRCTFQTPEGGSYRITATVKDAKGRRNMTQITRWVSGGKMPSAQRVEQESVTLIPERDEYQPGDTVRVLVQAPFTPAEGLLTVRRLGIVHEERFRMDEPSITLEVPVTEADVPNVTLQVDLVGAAQRLNAAGEPDAKLPTRPAYATGLLDVRVPPYARTLHVLAEPRMAEIEPGGETTVDVRVTDAQGKAVKGAEVALIVVDEAILALTGYELADPVAVFYPNRDAGVRDYHLRSSVLLVDPTRLASEAQVMQEAPVRAMMPMAAAPSPTMAAEMSLDMAKGAAPGAAPEPGQPIRVRSDMNPLALFSPETPTDADGSASVALKLPDSLTRYRIMAVAVAGDQFYGKGESSITARLPLMVRPAAPRFLNFGDRFSLPVVLQNQTDAALEVDVAVQATNLALPLDQGRRVTVPARDRVEVRFAAATEQAGTARFVIGAASGAWADAAQGELPVYTPATTEAFATYGVVDKGAIAQPILAPTGVYTQFGGLEITTSSTALQALTDAVLYLVSYPYECSEQLASRILAVAALRDVLSAFRAEGLPSDKELDAAMKRDIERLQNLQNWDGGFPVWSKGKESWPFYTIHAAHALARARQKDYVVSDQAVQSALNYLRDIESHYPPYYSEWARRNLSAYALYTRLQLGDHDPAKARKLIEQAGIQGLEPEALGWLYNVLVEDAASQATLAEIERYLGNRVVETAGAAHFATSYAEEEGYVLLASDRRADAIVLEALMRGHPTSDLIPKIVTGLLAHRKAGRWGNTQENVFVLLALDRYFNTYEAQTPDFVAKAWLGQDYVGEFAFRGRTTEYQELKLPMSYLAKIEGKEDLILSKDGAGRLYYRLGLRYAPTDLTLEPLEAGFTVQRAYEAVDSPSDVYQDERGVWHIKAGARVRVRLTMVAPTRRYHVALADPLPAGLEPMNPALAVTGSIPQDPGDQSAGRYWWWRWTWYEHQNLRDQRAEAFASLLWEGIHTYTYVARATTPGEFVVPPAKAEEMYSPEVFGRSGSDKVIVE